MSSIFVNRTLNLKKVRYMGFDMDHTLVRYHTHEFEELTHRKTLEKLVSDRGYPESILTIPFEYQRVVRGLVIDRKNGNLLKLSMRGAVRISFHGTRKIDYSTQKKFYRGTLIDLSDPNFFPIDTAFSIAYANLYARLVDLKEGALSQELPSFDQISQDVLDCVDLGHRDGSIKGEVARDLERYVKTDPDLVRSLERYALHGKRLFVLTNSDYDYTRLLLDHAILPHLQNHGHWLELFDFVITLASKPRFFFDRLPFFTIDPQTGNMRNRTGKLEKGAYQGGCAATFTEELNLDGEDILYVGDHIYGDILRLKKDCAWRTAMVIDELAEEIEKTRQAKPFQDRIWELMAGKEVWELELRGLEDQTVERGVEAASERCRELRDSLAEIDARIGEQITQHQNVFNPYWGEVMRIGNEGSYFADQVERYACVYASCLADLLSASPRSYFRIPRRPMPHEM